MGQLLEVPNEFLRKGYYFHSEPNDDQYVVFIELKKNNVIVIIKDLDTNQVQYKDEFPKKGDEITCLDDGELVVIIDVWHKYYFPTFNNDNNQWYHDDCEHSSDTIKTLHDVMKFGYDLAMKELKNI